jgi:chorismate dehydratase
MRPLRVSAISFLNTAPLMWDFQHGHFPNGLEGAQPFRPPSAKGWDVMPTNSNFEISYTIPSRCAEQLSKGQVDIGIIPAITYATIPNLVIVPKVAIASKRTVRSILLVSKVPLEEIRTVAADTSSRTSVALLRVLFEKWWGGARDFISMEPKLKVMLESCDAALLIGDPALQVDRSRGPQQTQSGRWGGSQYLTWDLAEEWNRFTGKPFVFAVWAMRLDALKQSRPDLDVAKVFQLSRDHGLEPEHLAQIASEWAPRLRLSEQQVTSYLTENIDYALDGDNLAGLTLFYRYAAECGVIPKAPELRFLISNSAVDTLRSLDVDHPAPVV